MIIDADLSSLKTTKPHEYAIRFFFGGAVTAIAGLIAKHYGPVIGGLFLAFPAIFPASVTLITSHEEQRKRKAGYDGTIRSRLAASLEAAGTCLGALALLGFALILYRLLPAHSSIVIFTTASIAWLALSVLLWLLAKRIHISRFL
jgi:Protein of unknown function (DUF3147)